MGPWVVCEVYKVYIRGPLLGPIRAHVTILKPMQNSQPTAEKQGDVANAMRAKACSSRPKVMHTKARNSLPNPKP